MERQPITTGTAADFSGAEYEVEELPPAAECSEGDTCEIHRPGGSGWYAYWYILEDGQWSKTRDTRPWQMRAC